MNIEKAAKAVRFKFDKVLDQLRSSNDWEQYCLILANIVYQVSRESEETVRMASFHPKSVVKRHKQILKHLKAAEDLLEQEAEADAYG